MKLPYHYLFFTILLMGFFANSQSNPKKKAQVITNEMSQFLDLTKKESNAVFQIQLNRFIEAKDIRSKFFDQPTIQKEKLKLLGNKVYNDLKNLLGVDRIKKWKDFKNNKNHSKK